MPSPTITTISGRYQVSGKPVGQGGMGVVYKAYDLVTKRHVALKTMRGLLHEAALELFSKEWTVLAQISHPNIVDVLDTGEFEEDGERKPFFVMPLLPGYTLEQLMQTASPRLTPERMVGIVCQGCRGLQAAHERGLIHRDLKPSNIFVMDDDTVKIIDFGVVHLAGADSVTGIKGTLQYMAPEQIDMKPCSPASDIYSLAVVFYEALTGRKPFARKTEIETAEAVCRHTPPPICDLNPLVTQIVSRVAHKAMAKDPWHRFSSAREFAEMLQKAYNGEPIERFDRARIQPRIDRAKRAQAEGDHQFAFEILTELEAEGNIDPEMSLLRIQIDQAIRQKSIRQLLDSARIRLEEEEFPLALQKIQEVLAIDPDNPDALSLQHTIETQRNEHQRENWYRLVERHLENRSFSQARQGVEEILKLNPNDTRGRELLADIDRREQEAERLRSEKEQLYQSALSSYQQGEISSALSKLERIFDLARRSPDSAIPERDAQYQNFYNQVRNEKEASRNAYAEGRRSLADRNFARALEICTEFLKKSPGDPMFQALQLEVEEQLRQEQSAFMADVSRRVDSEPDLDRRVNILREAVERYPDEPHLQQSLRLVRERRDLVNSIVAKARQYEERGQFGEALSQFDILRNIYAQYPGIDFETERLKRRRDDQVREEAKAKWVEQIDRHIALGDYARAKDLVRTALSEFPDDRELAGLERLTDSHLKRAAEAEAWFQRGQKLCFDRQFGEGLDALQKAAALDSRNAVIRSALLNALVEQARSVLGQDWRAAEPLIEQALNIDGGHPLAKSLQGLVLDYKRQEIVNDCASRARDLQASGDLNAALAEVEACLATYPNEVRLVQLRATLQEFRGASRHAAPKPVESAQAATAEPAPPPELGNAAAASAQSPPPELGNAAAASAQSPPSGTTINLFTTGGAVEPAQPAPPAEPSSTQAKTPPSSLNNLSRPTRKRLRRVREGLQAFSLPSKRFSKLQWTIVFLAPTILLAAFFVWLSRHSAKPAPAPVVQFRVDLRSNIASTSFLIDGVPPRSLPVQLKAGEHKAEALAPGYKPGVETFTLSASGPNRNVVAFHLEPESARVYFSSDLKNGKIAIDGGPPADLQDGGFNNDALAPSTPHTVSLMQGSKELLSISFQANPGAPLALSAPPKNKDVKAVIITAVGSRARIYATDSSFKGGLKDQPLQPIPLEGGLEIPSLTGSAEYVVDNGKAPLPLTLVPSNAPTVSIWVTSDPDLATIEIEANIPDADLYIDGRKRAPLHAGKNYRSIEPGVHTIRVSKEGYEPAPEQSVELKKGERRPLAHFDLRLIPITASLVIEGGTAGAEILIDGNPAGTLGPDGSFRKDDLSLGPHTLTLRKADFEPKQFPRIFTRGTPTRLTGADAQLISFGTLEFRISPPNASVTYHRADESQPHPAENGKNIRVRGGRYIVSATAPGYVQKEHDAVVEPGKTHTVEVALPTAEAPKKAPAPPPNIITTNDYFRDPATWKKEDDWWVHSTKDTTWFRSSQGVYLLDLLKQTGAFRRTKDIRWVIDEKDALNHIDYSFDFGSLERQAVVNGRIVSKIKVPVPSSRGKDVFSLEVDINQERVIIKDLQGKVLDNYKRPEGAGPLGRFGIHGEVKMLIRRAVER